MSPKEWKSGILSKGGRHESEGAPEIPLGDMYDFNANAEAEAAKRGCKVVYPLNNQVQLDIDSDKAYEAFQKRLSDLEHCCPDLEIEIKENPSMSGLPHRHIYITFPGYKYINKWKRIAIQFMLGSDHIRESLNTLRALSGVEDPTRLFEKR